MRRAVVVPAARGWMMMRGVDVRAPDESGCVRQREAFFLARPLSSMMLPGPDSLVELGPCVVARGAPTASAGVIAYCHSAERMV
jgi:hypothetical protein